MSLLASYLLAAAGSQSSPENWWVALDNANTSHGFNYMVRIAADSNGNLLVAGSTDNNTGLGRDNYFIAKLDDTGALQLDRELDISNNHMFFDDMAVDGNDDVYLTGYYSSNHTTACVKLDSGLTTNDFAIAANIVNKDVKYRAVTTDSSNEIYLAGRVEEFAFNDEAVGIAKCDPTTGSNDWKRTWAGSQDNFQAFGICVHDNSGTDEIFVAAYDDTNNVERGYLLEYNTSGTLQNQYEYRGQASSSSTTYKRVNFGTIVSDGTSLYVSFEIDQDVGIVKIDPADGDILWQKNYDTTGQSGVGFYTACAVTPDGNYVYVVGRGRSGNSTDPDQSGWLAKFATSDGTLQWQRNIFISRTNSITYLNAVYATNDNVYIAGMNNVGNVDFVFVAKLPGDGSGTNTFTGDALTIVYETGTGASNSMILKKYTSSYSEQASSVSFTNTLTMNNSEGGIEIDQTNRF